MSQTYALGGNTPPLAKEIQDAIERQVAHIQRESGFGEVIIRIVDHYDFLVSGRVDEKICVRPKATLPLTT